MRNYRVSESTPTATTTSVSVSGGSQPGLAIEQHQQGSFVDIPTTTHAPESTYIPAAERYAGLRLLAEVRTLHVDPFVTLATHQAVTFDDDEDQEQSARSLSLPDEPLLPNEPSQATDDIAPFMVVAQSHETGISEDPKRPSGQNLGDQNADSTDKWIMYSGDINRPFKCGYEGCSKQYTRKYDLQKHFVSHIGDSQFRCYSGDCAGTMRYWDKQALARHIRRKHTMIRPHACDICSMRFGRRDYLKRHKEQVHSKEKEQTTKKSKNQHRNERKNN